MKNVFKRLFKFLFGIFGSKFLVNTAFEIIDEELTNTIPFPHLQNLIRGNYDRLKIFTKIFLDKNVDNAAQVKEWIQLNRILFTDELIEYLRVEAKSRIKDVKKLHEALKWLDKFDPIPNDGLGNKGH